jgi:putative transposase
MSLTEGKLRLSNGRDNDPLVLEWPWELPQTVVIRWTGEQYEALATYQVLGPERPERPEPTVEERRRQYVAGIDLGEVHPAVSHDGEDTHILNGRLLRSKRQYQNKLKEHLAKKIDRTKKSSRRRKKLTASRAKQLKKIKNQIKDIEHQQTTHLITTLYQEGVQMVVIGDVKHIRQRMDVGSKNNQKVHQWSHGHIRHLLTYKAERCGMEVVFQEEIS